MSNASSGWRAYRPSRGKHKVSQSVQAGRLSNDSKQDSTDAASASAVRQKSTAVGRPTAPVNAWAAGPPVAKQKLFSSVNSSENEGSQRGEVVRGGVSGGRGVGGRAVTGGRGVNGRGGYGRGSPNRRMVDGGGREAQSSTTTTNGEAKFASAADKHQEAIKRHLLEIYVSSSEEEEENEDEEDATKEGKSRQILNSVMERFSMATSSIQGEEEDPSQSSGMRRTYQMLTSCLGGGSLVCLICISNVKKADAIWTCQQSCYSIFHLSCIQKWVHEGAYQQAATATLSTTAFPDRDIPWQCPKCRFDYPKAQCPTRYYCYCGKEPDPKFSPWNLPHSCGEICEKFLTPDCGHQCLLLCHPGPCPPCPQTIKNACFCGNAEPKLLRCGNRKWSCGKLCGKSLNCAEHSCKLPCHDGQCPPCNKKSTRKCRCGRKELLLPCSDPPFDCEQVCGKSFSCGHHVCEGVCHEGDCGRCPLVNRRTCPCGKKQVSNVSCTADIPGCGDTCEKLLKCGKHQCNERCHTGPCTTCRQNSERKCRCGRHRKKVQCSDSSEFHCQDKCQRMKDCERHQCKRKCCDGSCPPCDNVCGRTLACGKHKCVSRCHVGRCYPCSVTKDLKCHCGFTVITFPCGDKSAPTAPPRCVKPCRNLSNCHHPRQKPHRCHFGPCPPCAFVCDEQLEECDHRCDAICHDNVSVEIVPTVKRAGPWEKAPEKRIEIVKKPCPPCPVPMPVVCLGEHVTRDVACAEIADWSCGVVCGRQYSCGNHLCQAPCHRVAYDEEEEEGVEDQEEDEEEDYDEEMVLPAGVNCGECERSCAYSRPLGCTHPCSIGVCHPEGLCPPCIKIVKFRCHCKNMVKHLPCRQIHVDNMDKEEKEKLESTKACGGTCPKLMSCGHACTLFCHSGECSDPVACKAKVVLKCACKRLKKELPCLEVQHRRSEIQQEKKGNNSLKSATKDGAKGAAKGASKDTAKGASRDASSSAAPCRVEIPCDDKCLKVSAEKRKKEEEEEEKKAEEERKRNAEIAADFERKMKGPKRSRRHKTRSESEQEAGSWMKRLPFCKSVLIAFSVVAGVSAVVIATIIGIKIEG